MILSLCVNHILCSVPLGDINVPVIWQQPCSAPSSPFLSEVICICGQPLQKLSVSLMRSLMRLSMDHGPRPRPQTDYEISHFLAQHGVFFITALYERLQNPLLWFATQWCTAKSWVSIKLRQCKKCPGGSHSGFYNALQRIVTHVAPHTGQCQKRRDRVSIYTACP